MALKSFRPTSPAIRKMEVLDFSEITKTTPEKALVVRLPRTGGRNCHGHMTAKYRGGGHRRSYRIIDYKRDKHDIPAKVASIEYDPFRTARIALLHYADGEKRYILAPLNLKVGQTVMSGENVEIADGNALPLKNMPLGAFIHNIELRVGQGGKLVRAAGGFAQLMAKEGDWAQLRLPSGEFRIVRIENYATIGQLGNADNMNVTIGKAGRQRWKGIRPRVRPAAMNPVDHPHGGGEGRSKCGRHPCSFYGIPAKGYRTRNNKRTDRFRIRRRAK